VPPSLDADCCRGFAVPAHHLIRLGAGGAANICCLLAGLLLLVKFYQTASRPGPSLGGLPPGLAMWDKALATWMLTGIGIAGILLFDRQIFADHSRLGHGRWLRYWGLWPLIIYNVDRNLATFLNMARDTSNIPGNARFLMDTVDSRGFSAG